MYENWRVERLKGGFFIFIGKRRKYVVRTLYLGCRGFQERFFEDWVQRIDVIFIFYRIVILFALVITWNMKIYILRIDDL